MENLTAYLPLLLQGLRMTLILAVSTLVVGLALGMLLALAKLSRHAWLSWPVYAVTNFLRGIPEFLILLVIYFGGTQALGRFGIEVGPFTAGLTALSLVFGSYASETFRAAFQSVPHYHLHLIPRWTRDGKGFDWKLVPGDRTQIMAIGQKIRDAVEARR